MENFMKFPAQKSRTAFVVDEILRSIREGRYHVGDQLPPERILAEQLGVGRAAIREALSALQVMHIIERRIGDGTYVQSDMDSAAGLEPTLHALRENKSLGEVWEARKSVEIILAKLAVEKADERDISSLQESLERIERAITQENYEDYADADRNFHLRFAKAAKNPFLQEALSPLLAIAHQQVATQVNSQYMTQHGEDMVEEHQAILSALEAKDKLGIAQVVEHHFLASERLFLGPQETESLEV
ncbi:MAG: FadR family transcriptional regulator [Dehalococcoidia bacterium]|nr:FadR family transcriptional regulator [Dehalococcoidia bacterium]